VFYVEAGLRRPNYTVCFCDVQGGLSKRDLAKTAIFIARYSSLFNPAVRMDEWCVLFGVVNVIGK
jgi:hypothetical protein